MLIKKSTEATMNANIFTNLAPTLMVKVYVITKPQMTWFHLHILVMLFHTIVLAKYIPWKRNRLHLRILVSRPTLFLSPETTFTNAISTTLRKTSPISLLNLHHHWRTFHIACCIFQIHQTLQCWCFWWHGEKLSHNKNSKNETSSQSYWVQSVIVNIYQINHF